MASLTDKLVRLYTDSPDDGNVWDDFFREVLDSPTSAERTGVMAFLYHDGLGVERDLDKSFELAERAIEEGKDGLGYYLLGFMCDHAETPDQATGGDRQKYDQYDAERFYEICAEGDSYWSEEAHLWLGEYFLNMARGGDPEEGLDHYKAIADRNAIAAGRLSDYYWDLAMPDALDDEEWTAELYRWTVVAARLDPEEYAYRLGWLLLDGIGCREDKEKAIEYFKLAYSNGDWRGARTMADLLSDKLGNLTDTDDPERDRLEKEIAFWSERADKMKEEEDLESENEENCIEED